LTAFGVSVGMKLAILARYREPIGDKKVAFALVRELHWPLKLASIREGFLVGTS